MSGRPLSGTTFVLRCDCETVNAQDATLFADLDVLRDEGIGTVIVAPDAPSARTFVMRMNLSQNRAVGVTGADGALLPHAAGGVGAVQPEVLLALLEAGFVPIVEPIAYAPIAAREESVEADDVARAIGIALRASRAIFFHRAGSIANPITNDPIPELTAAEALAFADDERFAPDLRATMRAAARGVRGGIGAAAICDGRIAHAAVIELLTEQHVGTRVTGGVVLAA
ncbi:MAG: hypothetical protein HKL91_00165 [Candidatus Eremiobacteraeota bacterium]|nr:hypothetical protein [Candidatus Eremiobacteraeota bacterium]